jgi:hypothetical protein
LICMLSLFLSEPLVPFRYLKVLNLGVSWALTCELQTPLWFWLGLLSLELGTLTLLLVKAHLQNHCVARSLLTFQIHPSPPSWTAVPISTAHKEAAMMHNPPPRNPGCAGRPL